MPFLSLKRSAILAFALALAGCSGDARRQLGLTHSGPDAFAVVNRAPLDMPPDFGLRPPKPGAGRPNELSSREQARGTLFGAEQKTSSEPSSAEAALLKAAGADRADPNIRETVDREARLAVKEDRRLVDSLVFWRDPPEPGTIVDAAGEAARLNENAALGLSPSTGATPVITRKR